MKKLWIICACFVSLLNGWAQSLSLKNVDIPDPVTLKLRSEGLLTSH